MDEIEQLKNRVYGEKQEFLPFLQVKAIVLLAEQVKRIADLLESIVTLDGDTAPKSDLLKEWAERALVQKRGE